MIEIIVTLVKTESMELPRAEIDTRIAKGEPVEYAATEVHRIEFETEDQAKAWLELATDRPYNGESTKLGAM